MSEGCQQQIFHPNNCQAQSDMLKLIDPYLCHALLAVTESVTILGWAHRTELETIATEREGCCAISILHLKRLKLPNCKAHVQGIGSYVRGAVGHKRSLIWYWYAINFNSQNFEDRVTKQGQRVSKEEASRCIKLQEQTKKCCLTGLPILAEARLPQWGLPESIQWPASSSLPDIPKDLLNDTRQ